MSNFLTPAEKFTQAADWLREARHALMEAHTALLLTEISRSELQTIMNLVGVTRLTEARIRKTTTATLSNTLHVIPNDYRPRTRVELAADVSKVAATLASLATDAEPTPPQTINAMAKMRMHLVDIADDLTPGIDKPEVI